MASKKRQNELYANLMGEVKVRIDCINIAVQGRTGFPTPIVREFCYLQLRFLCELIALSCLVAHGDIASLQSHKTGRAWSADEILDRLTKLRPHFYPFACRQIVDSDDIWRGPVEGLDPQPLPKDELLSLYGKTHKFLHRGNLKKLLSSATPIDMSINLREIVGWAQKINDQLSFHTIVISQELLIICMLRNKHDNNNVQVANAVKGQPPSSQS
jgi:hypothetical protein